MNPLNWWVQRTMRDEEAWVHNHHRARQLVTRAGLWLLAVFTAIGLQVWLPSDSPWSMAAGLLVGGWAGVGVLARVVRAQAYRNGWLGGRTQMLAALVEALNRGMTLDEWIVGEMARDQHLLGASLPDAQAEPKSEETECPSCDHAHPDCACDCGCEYDPAFCGVCGWLDCECES